MKLAGAVLWAAAALASPASAQSPADARARRDEALDRLAVSISSAVARKDTGHAIFSGSIDWHSAVHGHWALLRIARATGRNEDGAAWAARSLAPEGLAAEAKLLGENPSFEMPYGRAWFLRLALEFEAYARERELADPDRLSLMADRVAESLLAYYRRFPPHPGTHNYWSSSWALSQLAAYLGRWGMTRELREVEGWVRERFLEPAGPGFEADFSAPEFFSSFGNQAYLVAGVLPEEGLARLLKARPITDQALRPVTLHIPYPHQPSQTERATPHHLGMNWSRAWSLKRLVKTAPKEADQRRFERAYWEHVRVGLEHHRLHRDDYGAYGHWVPQFAVYALTEGDVE